MDRSPVTWSLVHGHDHCAVRALAQPKLAAIFDSPPLAFCLLHEFSNVLAETHPVPLLQYVNGAAAARRPVPHSCPKRPRMRPRSHAGLEAMGERKPAWLLPLVVGRRHESRPSGWLPKPRVAGSSPVVRFARSQASLARALAHVAPPKRGSET